MLFLLSVHGLFTIFGFFAIDLIHVRGYNVRVLTKKIFLEVKQ